MISLVKYTSQHFEVWNQFNKGSKNGLFLFDRNYMDYHADRFIDHSLLFYKGEELLAIFPANKKDGVLTSHGGLTYGGLVLHPRATTDFVMSVFDAMMDHMRKEGISSMVYKVTPYIFHKQPAQEDLYALFRNNAQLVRRDISSVIDLRQKQAYTKGTKYNISKAKKSNLQIVESIDFDLFMRIEEDLLMRKYQTKPTHSSAEIGLLASRFPNNIRLVLVYNSTTCLGGTILFITESLVHTQYIGITDEGKEVGALDILTDHLIQKFSSTHMYFSFGISTEKDGTVLNEGLIKNKESFGARAITNDFYRINL